MHRENDFDKLVLERAHAYEREGFLERHHQGIAGMREIGRYLPEEITWDSVIQEKYFCFYGKGRYAVKTFYRLYEGPEKRIQYLKRYPGRTQDRRKAYGTLLLFHAQSGLSENGPQGNRQ